MASKTFLVFPHKIDIYQRTTSTNAAGQKTYTYAKSATIEALFQGQSSERRIAPYVDNIDEYQFYIPYKYAQYISYNNRIQGIKDRYGNLIEAGPLEIVNIQKQMGFGGRLHHLYVSSRFVVEHA